MVDGGKRDRTYMNRNQALIEECNALAKKVEAMQPEGERNPQLSVAIGGLHTCRDNLTWHGVLADGHQPAPTAAAKEPVKK
jgi:hypothetical protein